MFYTAEWVRAIHENLNLSPSFRYDTESFSRQFGYSGEVIGIDEVFLTEPRASHRP